MPLDCKEWSSVQLSIRAPKNVPIVVTFIRASRNGFADSIATQKRSAIASDLFTAHVVEAFARCTTIAFYATFLISRINVQYVAMFKIKNATITSSKGSPIALITSFSY